jgi:hypothetical protein
MSAAAVSEVDLASRSTTLEPYGQLIRMLMPRAQSIAIDDRRGVPAWMTDGRDVPEVRRLLQEALSAELRPGERSTGRKQPLRGAAICRSTAASYAARPPRGARRAPSH